MPSRPSASVRTRLSLSFLAVIVISWGLSALVFVYFGSIARRDFERARALREADLGRGGVAAWEREAPADGPPPPRRDRPPPLWPWLPPLVRDALFPSQLVIAVVLSILAGAWLSRRLGKPLADLAAGARAFQDGRLGYRIPEDRRDEFAGVARTMNAMAERLQQQIGTLENDARRRQQLVADLAHELRSPVATLKTMAQAMRDGLAGQGPRRERALAATMRSVDRLEKLVNDMLVIARLDLRQLPLDLCPLDLGELAGACVEAHRMDADRAGVTLAPVEADEPVAVLADPVRLAQVVDNLLDNAVCYAGIGAVVRVRASSGPPPTLEVADTGVGVPDEHLPSLFDPFYRVDPSRDPTEHHSGLGLPISRGLVEAHGGTLDLSSKVGEGTTVTITLPAPAAERHTVVA